MKILGLHQKATGRDVVRREIKSEIKVVDYPTTLYESNNNNNNNNYIVSYYYYYYWPKLNKNLLTYFTEETERLTVALKNL